jgi:Ser/Thr protein kinase RdoA (MazF antagonist)
MWIDALQQEDVVGTVTALPAKSGERVIQLATDVLPERSVVLFAWEEGAPPDPDADLLPVYRTLGAISAGMHEHARRWQQPAAFTRFAWDFDTALGPQGHWGPWQDAVGLDAENRDLFQRTVDVIDRRLQAYGKGPARYGLIHADMRPANVLVLGDDVRAIDFDDCGSGWFMYDFATTISFIEEHPMVPEWRAAWLEGYRSAGTLSAEDEAELDTFVMLRRMMLLCWVGSHYAHAIEAQELGADFTLATCPLAETYLSHYA